MVGILERGKYVIIPYDRNPEPEDTFIEVSSGCQMRDKKLLVELLTICQQNKWFFAPKSNETDLFVTKLANMMNIPRITIKWVRVNIKELWKMSNQFSKMPEKQFFTYAEYRQILFLVTKIPKHVKIDTHAENV